MKEDYWLRSLKEKWIEWLEESWWRQKDLLGVLNSSMRGQQIWIGTREKVEERKKD